VGGEFMLAYQAPEAWWRMSRPSWNLRVAVPHPEPAEW
jgi:hypothetical protein